MNATIMNKDRRFLPVILGTDANAYGMARAFHEAYGVQSLVLGTFPLWETRHSAIVEVHTDPDFDKNEGFLARLDEVRTLYRNIYGALLLIPCGDHYSELCAVHRDHLREQGFLCPTIDNTLRLRLENKADFYQMCEAHGLPYPATVVVGPKDALDTLQLPFGYPVAVKASDSIAYLAVDFPGRKKGYKAESPSELQKILQAVFNAGYKGEMIIQDFIPGEDDAMYVLNSYSNGQGKVQMMCLGHCVLEDYTPQGIGNYNAIIQEADHGIYETYRQFLEAIGYEGFSNFDLKFDPRDRTYKVFEINIRQGRSSFFATASGANLAEALVRDLIEGEVRETPHYHDHPYLWLNVPPRLVKKYASPAVRPHIDALLKAGRYTRTLLYPGDLSLKRRLLMTRLYHRQWKNFRRWFGKRTMTE